MSKVILVTGGLGFIGSNLVESLLNNSDLKIINFDKVTYAANKEFSAKFNSYENYKFIQADICNEKVTKEIFHEYDPDIVFHLAAESHVDNSIENPSVFLKTNIIGTYNLLISSLDICKSREDKDFLFHHISTDEVYGDLSLEQSSFTETSRYDPSSPYSASKASSDHLVRAWNRTYQLPTIITNCSNNYGPNQNREKLIPKTILNALSNERIPIYGSGEQIRDWLFVEDHVEALKKIAMSGIKQGTFNIGGDNQTSNINIVKTICKILDDIKPSDSMNSYIDLIEFVEDRPGHDIRYAIDSSKTKEYFDWQPKTQLKDGLIKTVDWYLTNLL